jgi:hypothetical protein
MVQLLGRDWTHEELLSHVGRLEQIAGIELCVGGDGPERGVRTLAVRSGAGFDFEILVDRGFDVGRASMNSTPLAWWSPVGLVGPWYYEPSGLGWFRGFAGGLVSTCGLDHTLLGGNDDATVFDFPHRAVESYGLHGRYTGLPARLAGYGTTWTGDEAIIWAEGEVAQVAVFGEQLRLTRRIEVDLGGSSLRITDQVTNIGPTKCPHMFLYHCNVGFPVVEEGSELSYPANVGVPVSDARIEHYRTLSGPTSPYVEQCYEHDMVTDDDGWVSAGVLNRARGIGVFQRYRKDQLPHHITWRQLGRGTYVLAMEPSTNHDAGRFDARERGELIYLDPGEVRRYDLEIGALVGNDVERFASLGGLSGGPT